MGDTNISWESDKKQAEIADEKASKSITEPSSEVETPREVITGDNIVSVTAKKPEVEELHRNNIDTVDTPEPSSLSMESPRTNLEQLRSGRRNYRVDATSDNKYGLPLGPAAGLGPQVSITPTTNREIFSVRGTRSVKINRHRDSVTVFPSGCMGIPNANGQISEEVSPPKSDNVDVPMSSDHSPTLITTSEMSPTVITPSEQSSPVPTPSVQLNRPSSAARNPLTGEGYTDKDYKRQSSVRRRDGNPLLGQGYNEKGNSRPSKVPPGGFSNGLW